MSNPYKDIASYGYKDSSKFKGREEDIKKFFSILNSEICSVLYAESGIGKTSFINAGIEPIMIQRGFFPIHVLIPEYVFKKSDTDFSIETWLVEYIKSYNENDEKSKILDKELLWEKIPIEIEDNIVKDRDKVKETLHKFRGNLWWLLHTYSLQVDKRVYRPYIVFDQFEEIFVKTAQERSSGFLKDFFSLMEQVTSNSIPDIIRSGLDELADVGAYFKINSEAEYKITFSLRKEFLSDFDYWTNEAYSISELYRNRMMLRPLTKKQAENVITKQPIEGEAADGNKYDETLKDICDDIIKKIDDKDKDVIEPVLLSIICSRLYDKASTLQNNKIDKIDLQIIDISTEIRYFYDGLVQKLVKEKVFKGKRDVERFENLFVSEVDGHRMRKSMRDDKDLQAFAKGHIKEYKDSKDVLRTNKTVFDDLEGVHLIRRSNVGEDTYIELIHDRFADVIHQRQISRSKTRQGLLWIIMWACLLIGIFFYTLYFVRGNADGKGGWGYFTEIENRTVLSEDSTIKYPENFAENFILSGEKTVYNFSNWTYLKSVRTKSSYDRLMVDLYGCPLLQELNFSNSIKDLIIKLYNVPSVNIYIGPNVEELSIDVYRYTNAPIFTINNNRYKKYDVEIDQKDNSNERPDNKNKRTKVSIVYDSKEEKAVYIPSELDSIFEFPVELRGQSMLWYQNKKYYNKKATKEDEILNEDSLMINQSVLHYSDLTYKDKKAKYVNFSDSVVKIGYCSFQNFENLRRIRLSENIDSIDDQAFAGCVNLEQIEFPKSLRYIGPEAFLGCVSLKKIVFSGSVPLYIDRCAFYGCKKLEYIELPDSVIMNKFFSPTVFKRCPSIKDVIIRNPSLSNLGIKDGVVYEKATGMPLLAFTNYCKFNLKRYYSKNGIIFHDSIDSTGKKKIVSDIIPSGADFVSMARGGQYSKTGDWVIDWVNQTVFAIKPSRELRIPALSSISLESLFFEFPPDSLQKIYVPYPQPETKDKMIFSVYLPDSILSKITLVVPKGCIKYYANHPRFTSFKSIEEDDWWRGYFNNFIFYAKSILSSLSYIMGLYSITGDYTSSIMIAGLLLVLIAIMGWYVIYKIEEKFRKKNNRDCSYYLMLLDSFIKLCAIIVVYSILYWFVLLVLLDSPSVLNANVVCVPLAIIVLFLLFSPIKVLNEFMIVITYLKRRNWKRVIMVVAVVIACSILIKGYQTTCDLEKMLVFGKYSRATSLMYSQIMNKDSIVSEDSILIRKVLLSSEGFPYLAENEGFSTNVTSIEPFKDKNLLLITKQDSVILLDFANHEQHKYKIPQSKSYYVDDKFVCGYSNSDYAFICKRKETVADSIKGWNLHFADNGKYVVSKTDSMCYIYNIQKKPKIIKAFHWENPSFVEVMQSSHYLAVQKNSNSPVEVYDISCGEKIFASGVKGRLSFLSDSLLITSDYEHTFIYKLNNTTLSLLHEIKGYSPTILENNEINIITRGGSYKFFHRINNSECRTDSVNTWIYSYQIGEYSKFWNWDVVRHLKKLGKQSLISLNDRYMIVRNDSSQTTSIYDINRKCRLMKSIKGKSPEVLNSEGETLFCIKSLQEDSIYVYKGIKQIFKHPHNSYQSISNNYLLERFGDRVKIIRLDNPSESYILEDEGRHFPVGDCVIFDGWIFNKYRGNYDNILPTDELIDRCDYLSEKQKQGLKRKITYQSSGN